MCQDKNKELDDIEMNDLEKLRVILPHWIEHNIGHGREFANWAETLSALEVRKKLLAG